MKNENTQKIMKQKHYSSKQGSPRSFSVSRDRTNNYSKNKKNSSNNRRNSPSEENKKNYYQGNSRKDDTLKVIVLGGLEEVGRNMTLLEYNKEIIIIDMGLQFPEEDMPGIDYIIPNISYLKGKEDWVKGVIITHGHYDHIGAIPHLMGKLGNPPMFTGNLTAGLIRAKWSEFKSKSQLDLKVIDENSRIKLGQNFQMNF